MFGEVPPYDRPPAVVEPLLPEVQRVPLVSHFPLVSAGRFWSEGLSPEKFFHRKILPERAAVCVEFYKDLEPHVGDGDDQVFRSTLVEGSEDRADAFPFDMFERLAAKDRVISANFVGPQSAYVLFEVRNIRVGERPRTSVECSYMIADVDEQAGNEAESRSDLENVAAIGSPEQMELGPLMNDPLTRVIGQPLGFTRGMRQIPAQAVKGVSAAFSRRNSAKALLATIIDSRIIGTPT